MINVILNLIVMIIILIGVLLIFDARIITNRFFSFGDKNTAVVALKILGFIISIIGLVLIKFYI